MFKKGQFKKKQGAGGAVPTMPMKPEPKMSKETQAMKMMKAMK